VHATRRGRTGAAVVLVSALVLVATACAGADDDKAGGNSGEKPVTLTLANTDTDPTNLDSADFVAAVERLSGGSIRVDVTFGWRSSEGAESAENGAVDDVRAGKVDLAVIPARAWDHLGIGAFRALLAPFLVDNLALEEKVVTSPLGRRMLDSVEPKGVVGIAVIPGELRRPFGISRALVAPSDYSGATIGVRSAPVADATFRALGASPATYVPDSISGLDGAELGVATIAFNRYHEQAHALTTNVAFWPRAVTVIMNREAFDALAPRQRDLLQRAGQVSVEPTVEVIQHDTETWLRSVCRRTTFALVRASTAERAALRHAVAPVYEQLERDPLTRELIRDIHRLRTEHRAFRSDGIRCERPASIANADSAAPLQGRWKATLTREGLRRSGAPPGLADGLHGSWTAEFDNGRFAFQRAEGGGGTGGYTVAGNTIRFVWDHGLGVRRGEVFMSLWSVYRDTLTFSAMPGRTKMAGLDVEPFKRVR
jgi:TRAP-type transport system periplasmic protein